MSTSPAKLFGWTLNNDAITKSGPEVTSGPDSVY